MSIGMPASHWRGNIVSSALFAEGLDLNKNFDLFPSKELFNRNLGKYLELSQGEAGGSWLPINYNLIIINKLLAHEDSRLQERE